MKKYFLNRKGLVIGIALLFIGTGCLPLSAQITIEKQSFSTPSISNYYDSLKDKNEMDRTTIHFLKRMGPHGSYEDYIKSHGSELFSIKKIKESQGVRDIPLIIVFINSNLFPYIQDEINEYNTTLINNGYDTVILSIAGGTAEDIKNQILPYWNSGYNVTCAVLIGDLPVAWFHHENDYGGPEEFPCDLYLMDLNGIWKDIDHDGMYDNHTDGDGNTAPEIYVGRIDASKVPGDEINITKNYLLKVHEFWTEHENNTGLTYTDRDWGDYSEFRNDIRFAYPTYQAIWYPNVTKDDYLLNRLPGIYDFIQLSCHSSSSSHYFTIGGDAYSDDVRSAPPRAFFYNLFCCDAVRFTDDNCLGNAYILNTSTSSLAVIGSTKTGSMLDFKYFYKPLGQCCSFGSAFKQWFCSEYPYDDSDISWFYGMTILGDPTLVPISSPIFWADANGPYETWMNQSIDFHGSVDGGEPPYTWHWDFGDGNTSEEQNPTHAYAYVKIPYTVTLTVTDNQGKQTQDITTATTDGPDTYPPQVMIVSPKNAVYIFNRLILPFFRPFVIGGINIEVIASDNDSGIYWVQFYVDYQLKAKITGYSPNNFYSWSWTEKTPLHFRHIITITARDNWGNEAINGTIVWKFL